ncbi:MAG: hypothetical protein KDD89_10170, partial [Anaerolineales bacterium]|nr:hypothetical protein [Anaerolineales bacterium]
MASTDANGYWDTGFQAAQFGDGTATALLVSGFTGAVGNDIDANNDGVIDNVLWTAILDDVAVADGGSSDYTYSTSTLQATTPGGSGTVGGASRLPNSTDTNTTDDWTRNDFDGAGIPALDPGSPALFEAENTRGAENAEAVPSVLPGPLINEFVFDHLGVDTEEYIEIAGSINSEYSRFSLLAIEGAITPTVEITPLQGIITRVYGIGTTNGEGTYNIELDTDEFDFDTVTLLLVQDFAGALGDDIDTDNDGNIDTVLWTNIADDVALTNGNPANTTYSAVVLDNTFGTGGSTPRGASRIPNATDTDNTSDWTENDFDGFGLPGFTGSPSPTEANNTPDAANTIPSATAPEWLGYNDSWNTATNWSTGAVPTSLDDVLIPAAPVGGTQPVLDVNAAVDTLNIEAGASLDLATFSLTAESGVTNEGTLRQTQAATAVNTPVTFLNIQNIAGDTDQYFGVIVTPTASSLGNVTVSVEGNQPYCDSELATLLSRCFEIVPQSVQSADIRFYYEQAEQNGQPANDLRLWLFGSSPWLNGSSTDIYTYSEAGTSCASAYCSFTADEVTQYGQMTGGVYNIFVWLGYTADWNDPANWSIGSIPTLGDTVMISGTAVGGNMPVLDGAANANDLNLEIGATIDLNGFTLTVQGNLDNSGTLTVGNGTLAVNGNVSN